MADLITHGCLALLLKRGQGLARPDRPLHLASFVAGNLLPDLMSRLPAEGFVLLQKAGMPVPPLLLHGWGPLHIPTGMLLASLALALLFPRDQQRAVLANLLAGMLLHLAVDLLQDHAGAGYLLLFPFSTAPFELGWIGSEATVFIAPVMALVAVAAWWRPLREHLRRELTSRSARPG